ncbi:class I SAM-dependent methyltransferase [Flavobacterium sp. RHBU_24]|uniref:class I SAM-dependent methyltransferase n=1 Tax=Flavobacterium sp. RHBU_24 TaxID=3391185 RepID=UPI00398554F7
MNTTKDNFSGHAADYANYRPYYPAEMIQYIASFVKDKSKALDVATGNGQVAVAMASFFKEVYATDISVNQLQNAKTAPNIYYSVGRAEVTGFATGTFDLVTVAQAIHWFDFGAFYTEVRRILKPDGVFAVLGYGLLYTNWEADKIIHSLYKEVLGDYWDAERHYIDENYETIPFPLKEIEVKKFMNSFTWTFEQLIGYLNTWSAVHHYIKEKGQNPIDIIKDELYSVWQASDKQVNFPLLLRLGRF